MEKFEVKSRNMKKLLWDNIYDSIDVGNQYHRIKVRASFAPSVNKSHLKFV